MRQSRYAVLPTPGDPFLLTYWWKYFKPLLEKGIVDFLVIVGNSPLFKDAVVYWYLYDMFLKTNGAAITCFNKEYLDHGTAIKVGLDYVPNDANVFLIEDDCIILDPTAVDRAFKHLEDKDCDIVCSPRHSCSNEIIDVATAKGWNFKAPCQEEGVNFWPNMFFSSKKILTDTDQNFNAKSWQSNEYYAPLDHTFKEFANGDTFVHASLQIKTNNPKLKYITVNQGHLHQNDDKFYLMHKIQSDQHCGIWSWSNPSWVHIGSLSMTLNSMLLDKKDYPLDGSGNKRSLDDLNPAAQDIYKQATFWCWKFSREGISAPMEKPIGFFWEKYHLAIQELLGKYDLNIDWLLQRYKMYATLGL